MTVAVVIPCYKVANQILKVVEDIGPEVSCIYVIDDFCPQQSGKYVLENCKDERVKIIFHKHNQGVGGAVMTGYKAAINDGAKIIVKIDGDGQMDPSLIPYFINPIMMGEADYTKGNRFYNLESLIQMPRIRLFGNAVLSFMTKISSGYWDIFDPTNGYTAIHSSVAKNLPFEKISKRYFFETDILFRLNIIRAVVFDVPMHSLYGNEISNLKINKIFFEFLYKNLRNTLKRIFYNYYLRDMSIASFELPLGIILFMFGFIFGINKWINSIHYNITTPIGTVMLAALPLLMGLQLILAFLAFDILSVPKRSKRFIKNHS